MKSLSPDIYPQLAKFDTATICNVIEMFNFRPHTSGTLNHTVKSIYPKMPPMVGHAITATFRSSQPASPQESCINLFEQKAAFEAAPSPRVMVVQDLDDPMGGAVYGEIMVHLCKAYNCVAFVTNGYARDIVQVEELDFPCFAAGVCASHANCRILSMNEPVQIAGVEIATGDLLHGDANGVTTIPDELIERVAEACPGYVAGEQLLMDAINNGSALKDGGKAVLAEFGEHLARLKKQVGIGVESADTKENTMV